MPNRRNVIRQIGALFLFLLVVAAWSSAYAQKAVPYYLELKRAQKWEEALAVIRAEIASPPLPLRNPKYLWSIRIIGIGALGDFASHRGLQPGMDEEAKRYYTEGFEHAGSDSEQVGSLRTIYARYFSNTKRNGLATPLFRENLQFWRNRNNEYMVIQSTDALATGYNDMGELMLSRHYRREALALAEKYFVPEKKPTPNQYLQYKHIIDKYMDNIAGSAPVEELDRLWAKSRDISQRYLKLETLAYLRAAKRYAIGGHIQRAEKLLADARVLYEAEAGTLNEYMKSALAHDFSGAAGTVHFYAGRNPEALAELETAQRWRSETGIANEDMAFQRLRGLAFERAGDIDKSRTAFLESIRIAERLRQSYSVAERAAFFRSVIQKSYHGLIRVSAKQAAGDGSIGRFWEAVQASEMVRARQLGDLIEPDAPPLITSETLDALRASLGPTRVVLYFTVTDGYLVILAFTADRHVAVMEPIDASFAESLRAIARDLSKPDSPVERIETGLSQVGRKLLGPVANLLQSRDELIVLPDGVLNVVPFDLLSYEPQGYRPLAQTYRVRLAPSLRFVGRSRPPLKSSGLLAVADPAYKKSGALAGIDRAELQAVTRGSRFLEYFTPLPETRTEVEAIRGLFAGSRAQALLGAQATESSVKRADIASYSFLHFATHGILGEEVPGVGEPALVLADEAGEDGFLTASEISSLKMDAQLAVLSACNTGSGEYVTGEGVMGLSRAFLIAGSRAVVVSLWPVASKQTERLMVAFYTNLRAGQDPHGALRNAKLNLRDAGIKADSIERHPFFWAPFIVVGDG